MTDPSLKECQPFIVLVEKKIHRGFGKALRDKFISALVIVGLVDFQFLCEDMANVVVLMCTSLIKTLTMYLINT